MIKSRYFIFRPSCEGIFESQWQSCFEGFRSFLTSRPEEKAFIVRVFVASENKQQFFRHCDKIMQTLSWTDIPFTLLA
jgi:hypothetical protein